MASIGTITSMINHIPQSYTEPCAMYQESTMYQMMCLNQAPKNVPHTYSTINQVYISTMYQNHKDVSMTTMTYTKPNTKVS